MKLSQHQIIDKLKSLLEIKYIYESKAEGKSSPKPMLIVILKENCSSLTQESSSMVAKIFQEETDYLYRIFSFEYAQKRLREGNLFFVHGCTWEKMVFHNPDNGADVFQGYHAKASTLVNIKSDFQKEIIKINAFMEGATFFLERENYPQATFMLHQYMELWFRTVELFMMGKERKCHSIKEHQTYIKVFVPELDTLFSTDDEEELSLLRLLDEAYITTRYLNNYHINEVQIQKIQEKAKQMLAIVSRLFKDKLAECRKYLEKQEPNKETLLIQKNTSGSEIPELKEGATLDKIKELAKEHFDTLKRYPSKKELFCVNLITDGYLETSFMISNLLKVCITALEADCFPTRAVPEPEHNIREVLGYILDMMLYEEMEFLDKIRELLPDTEDKCQS